MTEEETLPVDFSENALRVAKETLGDILQKMDVEADIAAAWQEGSSANGEDVIRLDVTGDSEHLGMLIGRKGETMGALEYLVRVITGNRLEQYVNLIVDVDGYRERRTKQLQRLATRLAQQVVRNGRAVSLEPMPSYERRIVHIALRENEDVYTESVGDGDYRKVVIYLAK